MNKLDVAVFQNDICWESPSQNFDKIYNRVNSCKEVDIIIMPEMFNTGFTNNVSGFSETLQGPSVQFLKRIAQEKDVAICTSLIIYEDSKYFNSFLFVKPDGDIVRYNKRHLFKMGGETDMFTGGQERVIVEYKDIRFLLQVCYDLRFPVWSRNKNDYDAIIYIANWPGNRRYIYDTLLRARAIENQAYVLAANRVNQDGNGIKYNGGSCVINSKGYFTSHANDDEETIIYASLDIEEQNKFKQTFPAFEDADNFEIKL